MDATTTTVINASDFTDTTTDPLRHTWTEGKIRYVIAALNGDPVAITLDRQTGHTAVGVRLVGIVPGGGGNHARVKVASRFSDGTTSVVNHLLFTLGPVITPLVERDRGAKWDALDMQREEERAAIDYARARHGETEGRAWGKWSATAFNNHLDVTYTPHTGNPYYADQWGTRWYGTVTLAQVAEQQAINDAAYTAFLAEREAATT